MNGLTAVDFAAACNPNPNPNPNPDILASGRHAAEAKEKCNGSMEDDDENDDDDDEDDESNIRLLVPSGTLACSTFLADAKRLDLRLFVSTAAGMVIVGRSTVELLPDPSTGPSPGPIEPVDIEDSISIS